MTTSSVPAIPLPGGEPTWPTNCVAQSAEELLRLRALALSIAWVMSGRLIDIPEFESKLAFGWHLYELIDLASELEARVVELKGPVGVEWALGTDDRARIALTFAEGDPARVVAGVYQFWLPRLLDGMRRYLTGHDAIMDAPSHRVVRRALPAMEDCLRWGDAAIAGYVAVGAVDQADLGVFLDLLASSDLPIQEARKRSTRASRDARFKVFSNSRSYLKAPDHERCVDGYRERMIELVRTNRDEIDALETFAIALHDLLGSVPTAMTHDLARFGWDEARHAAIGHSLLAAAGLDPFDVACSMIGINVRGGMTGWDAFAQISLFGELGIIGPMRALAREAHQRGDHPTESAFEFICADESLHLRRGREWLRTHHPAGSLEAVEHTTQAKAARRLADEGVFGEDYYLSLSKHEIAQLLGE